VAADVWLAEPASDAPFLHLKLWVGIGIWGAIWTYWLYHIEEEAALRRLVVPKYWTTALMALGLDLVALSLLRHIVTRGFLGVLIMVVLNDRDAQVLIFHSTDLAEPGVGDERTITVNSLYEDGLSDFTQLIVVFTAQLVIFLFVLYASLSSTKTPAVSRIPSS